MYDENDLYLLFLLSKRGTQSLKEAEEHCTVDAIGQRTRSNSPAHPGKTVNAAHVLIDKVSKQGSLIKLVANCEFGGTKQQTAIALSLTNTSTGQLHSNDWTNEWPKPNSGLPTAELT